MTALVEGGGREGRVSRLRVAVDALVTGCAVHVRITWCVQTLVVAGGLLDSGIFLNYKQCLSMASQYD